MVKAAASAPPLDDADQRGIGERVAEQPLHDRAGHGQQGADHGGDRDARDADRPEHQLVAGEDGGIGGAAKAERGPQAGEGNAGGADGCGQQRNREQQHEQRRRRPRSPAGGVCVLRLAWTEAGARYVGGAHCRQFTVSTLGLPISSLAASVG